MKTSILTIAAFSVAFSLVGCNRSPAPKVEQAKRSKSNMAEWKSVTLRFEGFKKSKSGAI